MPKFAEAAARRPCAVVAWTGLLLTGLALSSAHAQGGARSASPTSLRTMPAGSRSAPIGSRCPAARLRSETTPHIPTSRTTPESSRRSGGGHQQSQSDAIREGRAEEVQRRSPPRQGDVCARVPLLGDGRSDLSPQPRAAHLLPPGAGQGDDDLADGSSGAPRLPERTAFGESEAVLVRRVGRLLRRRHPRRRHHRSAHEDLRRQLPHAAQRKAARRRALSAGRRRQDSFTPTSRSRIRTSSSSR